MPGVHDAYHAVRLLEQHLPPCAGGSLDQTPSFIEAMTLIRSDERRIDKDRRRSPFNRNH